MPEKPTALKVAVLTVSDSRNEASDRSGAYLAQQAVLAGHTLQQKKICADNIYAIRSLVSQWIAADTQVILITGGTGFFCSDLTPEAVQVLFDKAVPGFGELFRAQSQREIGSSAIQSRALAGLANQTLIFALPGSTHACQTAWPIIAEQIGTSRRCNFAKVLTQNRPPTAPSNEPQGG